jgi:hypothetical protein
VHAAEKSGRFRDLQEATEHIVRIGRQRQARHKIYRRLVSRRT